MWIDSHAHLDCFIDEGDLPDMLTRARASGVTGVIAIGGSDEANDKALAAAREHEDVCAVLGYDRDEADRAPAVGGLEALLSDPAVVGVGETGLDYHYSAETASQQCALLEHMLDLACACRLPVVIHTRDAEADTHRLLARYAARWNGPRDVPGVIHCYTGDGPFARSLMDLGFMISFSGIVTFKKADALREVARIVPDDLLLVETDAPYLAPVPYRGKRNEPAYVPHVGAAVAAVRGQTPEEVARMTTANVRRLFGNWPAAPDEEATS